MKICIFVFLDFLCTIERSNMSLEVSKYEDDE